MPESSPLNRSQQDGIFDPGNARPVTLIGAGSVGSMAAGWLADVGVPSLTVWDGDDVSSHNVPMSRYEPAQVGQKKVAALAELVRRQSALAITPIPRMYAGEPLRGSVLACVDKMSVRQLIWSRVRDNPNVDVLVETRIAGEYVEVWAIRPCDPDDVAEYENNLPNDDVALRPTCGVHGIIYATSQAAAAAVKDLTQWWTRGTVRRRFSMLGLKQIH